MEDLPIAPTVGDSRGLEDGEFGFAKDDGRLFIGIPYAVNRDSEVAFLQRTKGQNVEIITEYTPAEVLNKTQQYNLSGDVGDATTEARILAATVAAKPYHVEVDYTSEWADNGTIRYTTGTIKYFFPSGATTPTISHTNAGVVPSAISLKKGNYATTDTLGLYVYLTTAPDTGSDNIVYLTVKEII